MSRCARVWNVLPKELTAKNIGIACFESSLCKYKSALKIYDVENPRTWKSIRAAVIGLSCSIYSALSDTGIFLCVLLYLYLRLLCKIGKA